MRERLRYHASLRLFLQPIISNRSGGLHRGLHIARLDEFPFRLRMVGPYAREAVRLQLDPHLELVRTRPILSLLSLLHLRENTEEILNVMTDLVRDHISFGKLTGLAATAVESLLELAEERSVQIKTLI